MLIVYTGDCDSLDAVACSYTGSVCDVGSYVQFNPDPCGNGEYLVRVGSSGSSAPGSGTISFECTPRQPSPDVNGDGVVNGEDLAIALSAWTGG